MRAVGRVRQFLGHGEREFIREAALDANREDAVEKARADARGAKENALAIKGPADDLIVIGMRGEALGRAAGCGHDVDIYIAIVFGGEGDERAIG